LAFECPHFSNYFLVIKIKECETPPQLARKQPYAGPPKIIIIKKVIGLCEILRDD
jgi:hypothetical protein